MNKLITRAVEDAKSDWRQKRKARHVILARLEETIAKNLEPEQARPLFLSIKKQLEAGR